MNAQERLDLKKLMQHNDYEDNTVGIRKLKHSDQIMADIMILEHLKKSNKELIETNMNEFKELCQKKTPFLFEKYTDIFNRVVKDELDLGLMNQVLVTLKKIENNEIDQQEGSVIVGKMLHKVFVESALKYTSPEGDIKPEVKNDGKKMCWKDYKKQLYS